MAKSKKGELHDVIKAAYNHVHKVAVPLADGYHENNVPWWHGWAIREAFIAGANWQHDQDKNALKKFFD